MKRNGHSLLATETFSMDIENPRVINKKTAEAGIGMLSHFYLRIAALFVENILLIW